MKSEGEKKTQLSKLMKFVARIITEPTTRQLGNLLQKEQFTGY